MIVPRYYENLEILHENTMSPRAYYIPASVRKDDLIENRENSDRFQLLNGEWNFKYFDSIYEVTDAFFEEGYNISKFDKIAVPGVWQMAGYDRHQYTNIRYPFPFDPPYIPQDIPCGAYVHTFTYQKEEKAPKAFLNFEGVDSCFFVWMNGAYVGYSQVSHATSEFDVTSVLKDGDNTIAVLVLKWCDGSYLEDQDKFRMSGIFRDVYLLKRPKKTIRDYHIKTKITNDNATVIMDIRFTNPVETKIQIEDKYGAIVANGEIVKDGVVEFTVVNPILWNTENPYLYKVIFTTPDEVIVDRIGFRTITIKDAVIYINGEKIKFRGVNRHDSDPKTGFVTSVNQIKTDLRLMKQHNFNAIRSSHYPNAPYFYQMCDEYGFMVIDEADIEAHGPFMLYRKEDTDQNRFRRWNEKIADDPVWEGAIVDRVQLMVERDKNRPCIVMWSMGNESAYGCNFEKALKWTKSFDPERITQYESARYRNYDITYNYDDLDLYSRMYPALSEIEEYLEKDGSKPFLLVEYCHSMGNGPGDFEDYFQMIHKDDRMCGGFVWEWCDHAIAHGEADNGKTIYHYGGDHGEIVHDSNFCMDGLIYPDRTPHTGLFEVKQVYRPVRCEKIGDKTFRLSNLLKFTNAGEILNGRYEITYDGGNGASKEFELDVKPDSFIDIIVDADLPETDNTLYIRFIFTAKQSSVFYEKGFDVCFEQLILREGSKSKSNAKHQSLKCHNETMCITVEAGDATYRFSKRTGFIDRIEKSGIVVTSEPVKYNFFRAPTDNDTMKGDWYRLFMNDYTVKVYSVMLQEDNEQTSVIVKQAFGKSIFEPFAKVNTVYSFDKNGVLTVSADLETSEKLTLLPRFGLRMFVDKYFDKVTYFGYGPNESYIDKHHSSYKGNFSSMISDMYENYIRPQENSSHFGCDNMTVYSDKAAVRFSSDSTFSFNASEYTQEELSCKAHNYELKKHKKNIICVDFMMAGVGSHSCGPELDEKYRIPLPNYHGEIKIEVI